MSLFGVLDGHGGKEISSYLAKALPEVLFTILIPLAFGQKLQRIQRNEAS
jgi:serine/threonine protein phosphatase PrpC